jgi:hypothetical protein
MTALTSVAVRLLGVWRRILGAMSAEASEMVTISRAEFEAMKAELRRLRLAESDAEALRRAKAFLAAGGPEAAGRMFTREELAEAWGVGD